MRNFETGATRDSDTNKYDYEGFLSPLVLERFGAYMHKHRHQADGRLRDSDNWQKGIPKDAYIKSAFRHFHDWWKQHRGYPGQDTLEESLCAVMFNVMGYLYETLKEKNDEPGPPAETEVAEPPSEINQGDVMYVKRGDKFHPVGVVETPRPFRVDELQTAKVPLYGHRGGVVAVPAATARDFERLDVPPDIDKGRKNA